MTSVSVAVAITAPGLGIGGLPLGPAVQISGLSAGAARPGDHASITVTMSDASPILSRRWGSAPGGDQFGTGSSPTDYSAADGGTLHVEVTTAEGVFAASASIRHRAPTISGAIPAQAWTVGEAITTIDLSDFVAGDGLSAAVTGGALPSGVTLAGGVLSGTPTANDADMPVTITVSNSGGAVDVTVAATIADAPSGNAPSISLVIFDDTSDAIRLTTDQPGIGEWHWARYAAGTSGITADGAGGWTAPPQEAGTLAVGAAGSEPSIPETGTTGTSYELALYQRVNGADSNVLNVTYTADNTAPVLSAPVVEPMVDGAMFGVSSDESGGVLYRVATLSATPPTAAQIMAGQDHTGAQAHDAISATVVSSGAQPDWAVGGINVAQTVYIFAVHEDAHGNISSILSASHTVAALTVEPENTAIRVIAYPGLVAVTAAAGAGSINIEEAA